MLLGTAFEVAGDFLFKKNSLVAGFIVYGLGTLFWAIALQQNELSKAVITFTIINILAACSLGFFALGESFSGKQIVGLFLAVIAIILVNE